MPSTLSTPSNSYDPGSALWECMHLEGTFYSLQEALAGGNAIEVRKLMDQTQAALASFRWNKENVALLEQGPFNESARNRILQVCRDKYGYGFNQSQQKESLARRRPDYVKSAKGTRGVLQLRGGGEKEKEEEEYVPGTPQLKPTLSYKIFNCLDDPVIMIGLIFLNLATTIIGFADKSNIISFLGTCTLYIMVFAQCLEIWLHTHMSKRMLEEKNKVRIRTTLDPAEAYAVDTDGNFVPNCRREKGKMRQGETGIVALLRERQLIPRKVDTGAFIQLDNQQEKYYYVPWHKYKNLEITDGIGDYFSDPMNVFNTLLLAFCVVSLYLFKAGKGAVAMRIFLVCLRVIRPVLRLVVSGKKVSRGGGTLGPEEQDRGDEEKGLSFGRCC